MVFITSSKPLGAPYALSVHGWRTALDIDRAGLADRPSPHPETDVSRLLLIVGGRVPLFVELRPHSDERVVSTDLTDRKYSVPPDVPGEFAEVDTAQLMFADGEGHELDPTGIYLLLYQYGVHYERWNPQRPSISLRSLVQLCTKAYLAHWLPCGR